MLRSLHLHDFRAFREFDLTGLGRVNLLVGTNNCGKTSVLEAIQLLSAPGSVGPLWSTLSRRGETHDDSDGDELEVAHIVHGHEIESGASFRISGANDAGERAITGKFVERDPTEPLPVRSMSRRQRSLFETLDSESDDEDSPSTLELQLCWTRADGPDREIRWPLTPRGGLIREIVRAFRRPDDAVPIHFITTEGLSRASVVHLFDQTVLTPDEEIVLQALRTIDQNIERLASVGTLRRFSGMDRGGIAMLVEGRRVPIGSMGDGIWRLLGISLALVRASGGVLLIDEIDTGLHYSVLVDLWKLVFETARRLDVQVFATTHSRDCYEALAAVAQDASYSLSLQRIERGRHQAVRFSSDEIRQAAERGIEVR